MNAVSNLVLCHRCWRRQKIRNGRIAKHKWHDGTCPGSGERI